MFVKREWLLVMTGPVVTILITPTINFDPINISKFAILMILSCLTFSQTMVEIWAKKFKEYRMVLVVAILFIVALVFPLIFTRAPLAQQLYGVYGRNTGFFHYLALLLIVLAAIQLSNKKLMTNVLVGLSATGVFEVLYAFLQILKIDPVVWQNSNNWLMGTLGNPNFMSAFLAISLISTFGLLLQTKRNPIRLFLLFDIGCTLFVILKTGSLQGLVMTATGILLFLYFLIQRSTKYKSLSNYYLVGFFGLGAMAIAGIFQIGPLASLLYKNSISYRGFYWDAAIEMTKTSPYFGVGLDSYGDYYRSARSIEAVTSRGPNVVTDSAHNVFLDLSSGGGISLALIYAFVFVYAMIKGYEYSKKENLDFTVTAGFIILVTLFAQSFLSINNSSISVWIAIFLGLLIGYNKLPSARVSEVNRKFKGNKIRKVQLPRNLRLIPLAVSLLVGIVISGPAFARDAQFLSTYNQGKTDEIVSVSTSWPQDSTRMSAIALVLNKNNHSEESKDIIKFALQFNPRDFASYQALTENSLFSPAEISAARTSMKNLDPLNPDLAK